jgi:type IV secretory pathway VirB4 component
LTHSGEYLPLIKAFGGQGINISATTDTYINPFDSSLEYEEKEGALNNKIEFVLAFIESIVGNLSGEQKTIIDRCTKNIYEEYQLNNYKAEYEPDFPTFYKELENQPEVEAKNLRLIIERYVTGGMDIFAKKTNIEIKNRFITFDISELPQSIQTTGYLVVLEHILNRLKRNKDLGKHTWIYIDEFHILLANNYSAEYIAKIFKIGRKWNAINTVITQNMADVIGNEHGRKILSNSEFALILKQKLLDVPAIQKIFDISNEEISYVLDSPAGQGIVVYGEDKLVFRNQVSKDSFIYSLNQTSNLAKERG